MELARDIPTIDFTAESTYRAEQKRAVAVQYGIVSFPRSGHNWLSRMLAEIIRRHNGYSEPACVGRRGGMGLYVGLRSQRPSQLEVHQSFYAPFPVVYGSHGSEKHDGWDPSTQLYLYRGFWAVWKSTKKANLESHNSSWWGANILDCLVQHTKHRWRFRRSPLKVSYEDLQRNTRNQLIRIVEHMGVCDVEEATIDQALAAGSRGNMLKEQELYGSPNPFQTVNEIIK